ncbi:Universal stress protein E [Pirellulimonas nuda]|uniref:Universal stress protein E n=1 Tax=Pirellulimonas nuda TaxID=2528009 RepID=A0A518DC11_9BACT|nr:universal stress protein [Pirellulimonas nuda]QDU89008.1 Universal stress protein E [Pirellulimonas nuda]
MRRFQNILVAVDLSQADRLVSDVLPLPTEEAIERALWLAKLNAGRLHFFSSLDVSPAVQRLIEDSDQGVDPVLGAARETLQRAVERAGSMGLAATMEVRFGKSWLEIIREVLRNNHDLVVAGTRHLGAMSGRLIGSTGIKLLRKCPCPVWITQPQPARDIKSILVAHDLTGVGDRAMELGCSMAQLHGARLHVLHGLDVRELETVLSGRVLENAAAERRTRATRHLEDCLAHYEFVQPPQLHVVDCEPSAAVMTLVERHRIELLVMGTIARSGIAGIFIGNTAERLLPQVPCSVLAVKPDSFTSPVQL